MRDTPRIGIYLSGGFDSSSIAATALCHGRAEIDCYTGLAPPDLDRPVHPGRYLDEREKVEALMRLYPSLKVNFITPRGANLRRGDQTRHFHAVPLPTRGAGHHRDWHSQITDAIQADGHRVVATGRAGNYALSWAGSFSLSVLLRQGRLGALATEASAIVNRRRTWPLEVTVTTHCGE